MRFIYVKTTNRCNLRCPHCYIKEYKGDTSLDVFEKASDYYKKFKDKAILIHGGEPTLVGQETIQKIVEMFKPYEYIAIQTNLHYNIDEWIDTFRLIGNVGTSLDEGRDKNILRKNVLRLIEEGINVRFNLTLTDKYIDEMLNDDLKFIEETGAQFRVEPYVPAIGKTVSLDYYKYLKVQEELMKHPQYDIEHTICGIQKVVQGGNCARDGLRVIEPNGDVYICPNLAGYEQFKIGNVLDENFNDLATNKSYGMRVFYERERNMMNGGCSGCNYWSLCNSGCVARVYFGNLLKYNKSEPLFDKDTECENIRKYYGELFTRYNNQLIK